MEEMLRRLKYDRHSENFYIIWMCCVVIVYWWSISDFAAGLFDVGKNFVVGLLADGFLLFDLFLGFESEVSNKGIYFSAVFLLFFFELFGLVIALGDFAFDNLGQFLLLLFSGFGAIDDLIHESWDVIFQGVGDLFHNFCPFLFFLLDLGL